MPYIALAGHELDHIAAKAAPAIAAAFACAGWQWRLSVDEYYVPGEAVIALRIRRQLGEVTLDHSLSSGRISVSRYIEDGRERASVYLDVADIESGGEPV